MKWNNTSEPFLITEEVADEMIASGYEFEPPPSPARCACAKCWRV